MDLALLSEISGVTAQKNHEERIFSILFQEDDLTWQTIIYDLVKTEQMDPWDINISVIADRFTTMLSKMKEMDFRIGGKMVLAAALLVKMKSDKLMKEDIVALDNLIHSHDEPELLDELDDMGHPNILATERVELKPRTPQPRQRKVSVYDLVEALEKALNVETRKQYRQAANKAETPTFKAPEKKMDVTSLINQMYESVKKKFAVTKKITFDDLLIGDAKEDKVYTFVPLLHLDNQRRIDLEQEEHFGSIGIKINTARLNEKPEAQPF